MSFHEAQRKRVKTQEEFYNNSMLIIKKFYTLKKLKTNQLYKVRFSRRMSKN